MDGDLYAAEFARCLREIDVPGVRKIFAYVRPDLPAGTDADVLASLHMARTQSPIIPDKGRVYSHEWLTDRGYPSQLPEELKPKPVQSRIVSAVGISVHSELPGVGDAVRSAMERSVLDSYADGRGDDPEFVKARMEEAKQRELCALGLKP